MSNLTNRAEQLAKITGGKVEWYTTRKQIAEAEGVAGVMWCGETNRYLAGSSGGDMVTANTGSRAVTMHGSGRAAVMTRGECAARGVRPGPANC